MLLSPGLPIHSCMFVWGCLSVRLHKITIHKGKESVTELLHYIRLIICKKYRKLNMILFYTIKWCWINLLLVILKILKSTWFTMLSLLDLVISLLYLLPINWGKDKCDFPVCTMYIEYHRTISPFRIHSFSLKHFFRG